ncbi:hypothetical protein L209DRAFT_756574 [Thermothelomyces heterothallicus CBS 203.75]
MTMRRLSLSLVWHLLFDKVTVLRATNQTTADEDNLEEIDLDNVIGRRTRGKVIDFAKAAAENPPEDDEDEEDDEDFVADDGKMDED